MDVDVKKLMLIPLLTITLVSHWSLTHYGQHDSRRRSVQ